MKASTQLSERQLPRDYLTQAEAATYCCVSVRKFRDEATGLGIEPVRFMGKLLYRREDLRAAIEREAMMQQASVA